MTYREGWGCQAGRFPVHEGRYAKDDATTLPLQGCHRQAWPVWRRFAAFSFALVPVTAVIRELCRVSRVFSSLNPASLQFCGPCMRCKHGAFVPAEPLPYSVLRTPVFSLCTESGLRSTASDLWTLRIHSETSYSEAAVTSSYGVTGVASVPDIGWLGRHRRQCSLITPNLLGPCSWLQPIPI